MTVAVFDKQARVVYSPSLENSGVSSWTRGEDTSDVAASSCSRFRSCAARKNDQLWRQ